MAPGLGLKAPYCHSPGFSSMTLLQAHAAPGWEELKDLCGLDIWKNVRAGENVAVLKLALAVKGQGRVTGCMWVMG